MQMLLMRRQTASSITEESLSDVNTAERFSDSWQLKKHRFEIQNPWKHTLRKLPVPILLKIWHNGNSVVVFSTDFVVYRFKWRFPEIKSLSCRATDASLITRIFKNSYCLRFKILRYDTKSCGYVRPLFTSSNLSAQGYNAKQLSNLL